jgi:hypothetical protein
VSSLKSCPKRIEVRNSSCPSCGRG